MCDILIFKITHRVHVLFFFYKLIIVNEIFVLIIFVNFFQFDTQMFLICKQFNFQFFNEIIFINISINVLHQCIT